MRKFLALIVFVIIPAIGLLWYKGAIRPVDASNAVETIIEIPKGSSTSGIAALLKYNGVIRSELAFTIYAKFHDVQSDLQAGAFALTPSMRISDVIGVLTKGRSREFTVTIPEGYTVLDIDALLAAKGLVEIGSIMECAKTCDFSSYAFLPEMSGLAPRGGRLEGYLFPDTYSVDPGNTSSKAFLSQMLDTFKAKIVDGLAADIKASGHPLHDIMTMASLIEEETLTDEERPIVSGILWKREGEGMGLGIDAAVRYIVEKAKGPITLADLNVDSPYNLRKFRGLPPGPIANSGLKSIEAALDPKDSPYWYYLHDAKGNIHYAETNEEHNGNRVEYLQ